MRAPSQRWKRACGLAVVGLAVVTAAPAVAQTTPGATLYGVTENMRVVGHRVRHRVAEGALGGTALLGTPFCPERLAPQLPPGATTCWITANGADDINLTTGQGSLFATITAVTTGDNPFAAPELVLSHTSVSGTIDFSPALAGLPFGTVEGRVGRRARFTGIFLQPFLGSAPGPGDQTLRQLLCPLSPTPNPHLAVDFAWLEVATGGPTGHCIDIRPEELSLGYPTLRFDLFFGSGHETDE